MSTVKVGQLVLRRGAASLGRELIGIALDGLVGEQEAEQGRALLRPLLAL